MIKLESCVISKVYLKNIQANKNFSLFSTCNKDDCQRKAELSCKSFTALFQGFQVNNNGIKLRQGMTQQADIYVKANKPGKTKIKQEVS